MVINKNKLTKSKIENRLLLENLVPIISVLKIIFAIILVTITTITMSIAFGYFFVMIYGHDHMPVYFTFAVIVSIVYVETVSNLVAKLKKLYNK